MPAQYPIEGGIYIRARDQTREVRMPNQEIQTLGSLSIHHYRSTGPCSLYRPSCSSQITRALLPVATTTSMWTKFSNVLKSRQDDNDTGSFFQGQHHPNMSTRSLVSNLEGSIQNQSPPGSPSKQGRRSMFKRTPKVPKSDDSGRSSPFGLPMGLPKRVKSHLNLNGNGELCCFFVHAHH